MSLDANTKRNLLFLDKVLLRASAPGFWGKVVLQFEDGKMRSNVKLESTIRINDETMEKADNLLDASMVGEVDEET